MIYTNFREIDKAGRIVISKDIRRHLNINPGDVLQINADEEQITIRKAEAKCVFCNAQENREQKRNAFQVANKTN